MNCVEILKKNTKICLIPEVSCEILPEIELGQVLLKCAENMVFKKVS